MTPVYNERFSRIVRTSRWIELGGVLLGVLTTAAIEQHVAFQQARHIEVASGVTPGSAPTVAVVCLLMAFYNFAAEAAGWKGMVARSAIAGIAIDLAFVTGVLAPTDGLQSLLFGLYYFVIIGAAMWWGLRGALLTALASMVCAVAVELSEVIRISAPNALDLYAKLGAPDIFTRLPYLFLVAWMAGAVTDAFRSETERRLALERSEAALREERALMDREMSAARAVQQSLLPPAPPQIPGLSVAFRYIPQGAVGGDFYDVIPLRNGEVLFLVADVSGHSLPAALLVAAAKGALYDSLALPPASMAGAINRRLLRDTGSDRFVTMVYALVDQAALRLTWINAGHPAPILLRPGEPPEPLSGNDVVLGIVAEASFEERHHTLSQGDALLLYTDGLVERQRDDATVSGYGEFAAALERVTPDGDAEAIADRVLSCVRTLGQARDDEALVVVKVDGAAAGV